MWLAGSAAAIGVAWAGVAVVDDQVIDPASATTVPTDLAGTPLPNESADGGSTTTVPGNTVPGDTVPGQILPGDTVPGDTVPGDTLPGETLPGGGGSSTTAVTARPGTSPTAAPSATTAPAATTPTTAPPATAAPTTAPPAPAATTQTFSVTGGTTAISFSASGVSVLWATPNPGFEVSIEPEGSGIKVEFRSDDHRSRVEAWWSDGPKSSTRED